MDLSGGANVLGFTMDDALFKRMQEAARRFRSGESDFEEIMTPAGPAHLVRDRNDPRGFRLDFVGDGSRHVVPVQEYPAVPNRPPGYPAPLPFLPHCRAVINTLDQSVSWIDPPDVEGATGQVLGQCLDDGWLSVAPESDTPAVAGLLDVLEKEGVRRTLVLDGEGDLPRLVLQERRPAASP
jgi:hypothetical protein